MAQALSRERIKAAKPCASCERQWESSASLDDVEPRNTHTYTHTHHHHHHHHHHPHIVCHLNAEMLFLLHGRSGQSGQKETRVGSFFNNMTCDFVPARAPSDVHGRKADRADRAKGNTSHC
jgi:hypothetical protein